MSVRRHLLPIFTLVALLLAPFAATPQAAAQAEEEVAFIVDNLGDALTTTPGTHCIDPDIVNPNCSLRQAIDAANASTFNGTKTIGFLIELWQSTGGAELVLTNPAPLPPIAGSNIEVDAFFQGLPRIAINGSGKGVGLELAGNGGAIRGLVLYGFTNPGAVDSAAILITGSSNSVEGSYIGLSFDGNIPAIGSNVTGIRIQGSGATNNTIGGALGNTIAGNTANGVLINNASGNTIATNQIGVFGFGAGAQLRGNAGYGVRIASSNSGISQNNNIGGTTQARYNVIGANGQAGILLSGTGTISNNIRANLVGLDGTRSLPNTGAGIVIEDGAGNNSLNGPSSAPLVISDNNGYGVIIRNFIQGQVTNGNRMIGTTFVGTTQSGNSARGNNTGGVLIDVGATNTVIQGTTSGVRISGNTGYGVHVRGGASGTQILGALIGVTPPSSGAATGTNQVANTLGGVFVENAAGTIIRSSIISGNGGFGVQLNGATGSTIQSSFIGLDRDRTATRGNSGPGVSIIDSENTLVGGENGRNYIAGNLGAEGHGVVISGTDTLSVTVAGNSFGLARNALLGSSVSAYVVPAGNAGDGVRVLGGGDVRVHANTIAESGAAAITVSGIPAEPPPVTSTEPLTVSLRLNEIGFLPTAAPTIFTDVGNAQGILFSNVRAFEVISNSVRYSGSPNLQLTNALTGTVEGNLFNNSTAEGVLVDGTSFNVTLRANTIRANADEAVRLAEDVLRIRLASNRMAANGGTVLLEGTSIYSGSGADPAQANPGANHDIDPPFALRLFQDGTIQGQVITRTNTTPLLSENDLTPISACAAPCTIQAFGADPTLPTPDGQGWDVLSFATGATIIVDTEGNFTGRIEEGVPGQLLLAATDSFGNTSAFAVFTATYGLELIAIDPAPPQATAAPTESVDYRLQLRNTGTVDFSNLRYVTSETLDGWTAEFNPEPLPLLAAGATRDITVTVTLPVGTNPNAAFPITDRTRVTIDSPGVVTATATLVLETSTEARPVLRVEPRQNPLGFAAPGDRATYQHRITNDGNIPVLVNIDQRTVDPADSGRVWTTTVSISEFSLAPGQSQDIAVNVTVPQNAQVNDGEGNPVRATTLLTATAQGYPAATVTFSDTTGVVLEPIAEFFSDQAQNARAGATVTFFHELLNRSNGLATFRFNITTNFGSEVTLVSNTPGVQIINNTVTLDAPIEGRQSSMQLRVNVRLNESRLPGDIEVVNIFLTDPATGGTIGANVVDTITVTEGFILPRLYLPVIGAAPAAPPPAAPPSEEPTPDQAGTTMQAL